MRNQEKRKLVQVALEAEANRLSRLAPPLDARRNPPKRSLLQDLARAVASPSEMERVVRSLVKTMPARYDGHGWWADTVPKRQVIRESVAAEIRHLGHTGIPPKAVDRITNAVIERARRRGRKPEDHGRSYYCECRVCEAAWAAKSKALFGEVLKR